MSNGLSFLMGVAVASTATFVGVVKYSPPTPDPMFIEDPSGWACRIEYKQGGYWPYLIPPNERLGLDR